MTKKIETGSCLVCSVCEQNGTKGQDENVTCQSQLTKIVNHSNAQSSSASVYHKAIDPQMKKPTEESQGRYEQIPSNHPNEIP